MRVQNVQKLTEVKVSLRMMPEPLAISNIKVKLLQKVRKVRKE